MTIEILYACGTNFDECKHWSDDPGECPIHNTALIAHDTRCQGDCPRCKGMEACGDLFMGSCLPCSSECLPKPKCQEPECEPCRWPECLS